jgi:hypothetical protein
MRFLGEESRLTFAADTQRRRCSCNMFRSEQKVVFQCSELLEKKTHPARVEPDSTSDGVGRGTCHPLELGLPCLRHAGAKQRAGGGCEHSLSVAP